MYQLRDFVGGEAGQMLDWLNSLGEHEVISCFMDSNNYWRILVRMVESPKKTRMVRPKGWKPGMPYVPMEDK